MGLKKQSIRKGIRITANDSHVTKDELILISESWNERQENFFRKMLKQGGKFKINGVEYKIDIDRDSKMRSDGTKDVGIIVIPGESGKF
jgi:hypothetical protein